MSSISSIDLARSNTDITVGTIPPKASDLGIANAFTWGSCLYAPTEYFAKHGRPDAPAGLRDHMLVRCGAPLLHARAFGWVKQCADSSRPATRVENSDSARLLIEQGGGIGPLFCAVGDTCANLERVFPEPFDRMDFWILYHESARGSHRVRMVLDALTAFLRAQRRTLTAVA